MTEYIVSVNFATYIGADEEYVEYADNEDDAIYQAIEDAKSDLYIEDIEDNEDGSYDVHVGFAGFMNVEEVYTVYADSEVEAEDLALEEASADLDGEVVEKSEEE